MNFNEFNSMYCPNCKDRCSVTHTSIGVKCDTCGNWITKSYSCR